jgi:hypothetical protein
MPIAYRCVQQQDNNPAVFDYDGPKLLAYGRSYNHVLSDTVSIALLHSQADLKLEWQDQLH